MQPLVMCSIQDARNTLKQCVFHWERKVSRVPLLKACGELLAENISTPFDIPAFARSMMDGYAVIAQDTASACENTPVALTLCGAVEMGKRATMTLQNGQCVAIPTGGMLPKGANSVVMMEDTHHLNATTVQIKKPIRSGEFIIEAGEDSKKGTLLLKKGDLLRPQEIGALAAMAIGEVLVYQKRTMTIIVTGDELVPPTAEFTAGQVCDINTYTLASLAKQMGFCVVRRHLLADNFSTLVNTVQQAQLESDFVLISGGSSVGKKDITKDVIAKVSTPGVLHHGLAIKPGKPAIVGYDEPSQTILMGMPGHPMAAMMVFEVLLRAVAVELCVGLPSRTTMAKLSCNLVGESDRTTLQPVWLDTILEGAVAHPIMFKSGLISTLTKADGYIMLPQGDRGLQKGESTVVYLYGCSS